MSRVALVVEFDIKPGQRDAFLEIIRSHAQRTRDGEEGCQAFEVLVPADAADKVFLYECYRDQAAFEEHTRSPLLVETRGKYKDMFDNRRIVLCDAG
jgi:quinol monooxygenase YgiN